MSYESCVRQNRSLIDSTMDSAMHPTNCIQESFRGLRIERKVSLSPGSPLLSGVSAIHHSQPTRSWRALQRLLAQKRFESPTRSVLLWDPKQQDPRLSPL